VALSTDDGDLVLDPFCGSGTTGAVALALGRRFVGVELNPEYVAIAARRLSAAPLPPPPPAPGSPPR
jgi:DNA modification methylase